MKAEIFVVNIDNYFPELCELTLPTIDAYAKKIGGKMTLITDRAYTALHTKLPVTIEKFQASKSNADHIIIVDADMIIHPNFWDVTEIVPKHCIGSYMSYNAVNLYKPNLYFERFGEYRGIATNFFVVPKIWAPAIFEANVGDMKDALNNVTRQFILDEYMVSLSAAKYGAKLAGITVEGVNHIKHINFTTDEKSKDQAIAEAKAYVQTFNKKAGYAWTK